MGPVNNKKRNLPQGIFFSPASCDDKCSKPECLGKRVLEENDGADLVVIIEKVMVKGEWDISDTMLRCLKISGLLYSGRETHYTLSGVIPEGNWKGKRAVVVGTTPEEVESEVSRLEKLGLEVKGQVITPSASYQYA